MPSEYSHQRKPYRPDLPLTEKILKIRESFAVDKVDKISISQPHLSGRRSRTHSPSLQINPTPDPDQAESENIEGRTRRLRVRANSRLFAASLLLLLTCSQTSGDEPSNVPPKRPPPNVTTLAFARGFVIGGCICNARARVQPTSPAPPNREPAFESMARVPAPIQPSHSEAPQPGQTVEDAAFVQSIISASYPAAGSAWRICRRHRSCTGDTPTAGHDDTSHSTPFVRPAVPDKSPPDSRSACGPRRRHRSIATIAAPPGSNRRSGNSRALRPGPTPAQPGLTAAAQPQPDNADAAQLLDQDADGLL